MKLTADQIEAVKTWRKGHYQAIVSDLPFALNDRPLNEGSARHHGGAYFVGHGMGDSVRDFLLAAAKAVATLPPIEGPGPVFDPAAMSVTPAPTGEPELERDP